MTSEIALPDGRKKFKPKFQQYGPCAGLLPDAPSSSAYAEENLITHSFGLDYRKELEGNLS